MLQLLSIDDVAARLGVSRRTAFKLVKQPGFIKAVRLGSRLVRYRESDLDAWVAERMDDGRRA